MAKRTPYTPLEKQLKAAGIKPRGPINPNVFMGPFLRAPQNFRCPPKRKSAMPGTKPGAFARKTEIGMPPKVSVRDKLRIARDRLDIEEEKLKTIDAQIQAVRDARAKVDDLEAQALAERTLDLFAAIVVTDLGLNLTNTLAPAHSRTSCDDSTPGNPDVCPRCFLLGGHKNAPSGVKWAFVIEG